MTETTTPSDDALSNLLHENRRFEPPSDLAEQQSVTAAEYEAAADPLAYRAHRHHQCLMDPRNLAAECRAVVVDR